MISLMSLLYQLSAGIGSVLLSNNLPLLSPQLTWSFYWDNCCFLSYSKFKGHWRVTLQVSSLPCYYSLTSICESHQNSKAVQLFTLLIKENTAEVSQCVHQQPLDCIRTGGRQTKSSLFKSILRHLISELPLWKTHKAQIFYSLNIIVHSPKLYPWIYCMIDSQIWEPGTERDTNISVHPQKWMQPFLQEFLHIGSIKALTPFQLLNHSVQKGYNDLQRLRSMKETLILTNK